jgi:guanylate kinase
MSGAEGRRPGGASGPGLVVVLAGPSGVGKGAVHAGLQRVVPGLVPSVSATTRRPRPGEVDGVAYRFVDDAAFDRMVDAGELLEWAAYSGHRYGTPRGPVAEGVAAGAAVLLEIEVQGALQVRAADPSALMVLLVPPTLAELERRLRSRGTETEEALARRLAVAEVELDHADRFDHVVVNDDLDAAVAAVAAHISAARGGRRG